jgi:uncharacterized membrane protein HdeD (DUF308 family)
MKIEIKSYNNTSSLVSAIIFFIIGAVMFTNPQDVVIIASYLFGGILSIIGLYKCIKNYIDIKQDNTNSSNEMILGITMFIIGLIIIFLAGVIEWLVRLVIGGWILFYGINRFIYSLYMNKKDYHFIIYF